MTDRVMTHRGIPETASRSSIVFGRVDHWRAVPREHSFSYPVVSFQLDVDELERLSVFPRLFGFNRRAIFSVRSADYLCGEGSLREKVERLLQEQGVVEAPSRITLITSPRYFGYVFNPVSFFACFDAHDRVVGLVTEVHNTFGETHVYPLVCQPTAMPVEWRFPKEFFVSPFFDVEGGYIVSLLKEGVELVVKVSLEREEKLVFSASLEGKAEPVSGRSLRRSLLRHPITPLLTMARIHSQACALFFKVGACPFAKPAPTHRYTIHSHQGIIHKARLAFLRLLRACRQQ